MKLYCSYAFTGENLEILTARMRRVVETLSDCGLEAYCPLFDPAIVTMNDANDVKEIFERAFRSIAQCDAIVAVVASDRRSEGQLMEIGAALSRGQKLYLLQHESAGKSHLPLLATETFVWRDEAELVEALKRIK